MPSLVGLFVCFIINNAGSKLSCVFWYTYARVSLNIYQGMELSALFCFQYVFKKHVHVSPTLDIFSLLIVITCLDLIPNCFSYVYYASCYFLFFGMIKFLFPVFFLVA